MGYLFLSFSLLAGATKGCCGKKMGNYAKETVPAVRMNLLRMGFCILFGVLMMLMMGEIGAFTLSPRVLLLSLLSGVSTALFVVTWLLAVRKSAYMMLDIFLTLGTVVPMITGIFLFGEPVLLRQWLGFGVLVAAAALMCSYNNALKSRMTLSGFGLLVLCGLANGVTDLSQKWFVKPATGTPATVFNLYTYVFAALTLFLIWFFLFLRARGKNDGEREGAFPRRVILFVLVMSLMLILSSYFKTLAAGYLDSARLYPLSQGAALVLSTLMAAVFFGEKPNFKCIAGIVMAFAGLLIMNL